MRASSDYQSNLDRSIKSRNIGMSLAKYWACWHGIQEDPIYYNHKDETGINMLRSGINLKIGRFYILEKYRFTQYTDLYINLLSNVEKRKMGWGVMSHADYLFYHMIGPENVKTIVINMNNIKSVAKSILDNSQQQLNTLIDDEYIKTKLDCGGYTLVKTTSEKGGDHWTSVGAIIDYNTIFPSQISGIFNESPNINFYICNLQGKQLSTEELYRMWTMSEPFKCKA